MASSATSTAAALISSNPRSSFSSKSKSKSFSNSLPLPNPFTGLSAPLLSLAARSVSLSRASHSRKSFVVKAASGLPLVGNPAPDFEAEAVFDQEFLDVMN